MKVAIGVSVFMLACWFLFVFDYEKTPTYNATITDKIKVIGLKGETSYFFRYGEKLVQVDSVEYGIFSKGQNVYLNRNNQLSLIGDD